MFTQEPNTDLNIEPINQTTLAEKVELRLLEYFKSEDLTPGDAIPKEISLAESMGVSRNVVREALSRLRMLGIVETRKKRGMVMGHPDLFSGFKRLLDPDVLEIETVKEIFELRLVIEMGLAELLFLRKTGKDISELKHIVQMNNKVKSDKKRLEGEVEFHRKLYKIAGNETLRRFQNMLLPLFKFVADLETKEKGKVEKGEVDHEQLVKILEKGTPEEFRLGMYKHLAPHFERLKNWS